MNTNDLAKNTTDKLERKHELFERMISYITAYTNGYESVEILRDIGFTDEEIIEEGFEIEEEE